MSDTKIINKCYPKLKDIYKDDMEGFKILNPYTVIKHEHIKIK